MYLIWNNKWIEWASQSIKSYKVIIQITELLSVNTITGLNTSGSNEWSCTHPPSFVSLSFSHTSSRHDSLFFSFSFHLRLHLSHCLPCPTFHKKKKNTHTKTPQVIRSIFGLYEHLEKLLWCYEVIWFSGSVPALLVWGLRWCDTPDLLTATINPAMCQQRKQIQDVLSLLVRK